jgi:phosphopantothenoylcysteine synthetase/decarboxylase
MSSRRPTRTSTEDSGRTDLTRRIVLGVTGSIAAFKAAQLASDLRKRGHDVRVVLTEAAQRFVTALTFRTLTGNPVHTDLWSEGEENKAEHLAAVEEADLMVIAPASADFIGRAAAGIANDMLSATLLAARCPVLMAPAMNYRMWENPIVQRNVKTLREFGYEIVHPEEGWLAEGYSGIGRLASVEALIARIDAALARRGARRPR